MIPQALRELVQVSRRTAREFKEVLEELGELIGEKQLEQNLQRERIPVRNNNEHPLSAAARRSRQSGNNGGNRFSSTYSGHFSNTRKFSTTRNIKANIKNPLFNNTYASSFQNTVKRRTLNNSISLSKTLRAAVYQTQPFKYSSSYTKRPSFIRNSNVVGSSMYSHFPKHNARMFSTYGPNMTHQVVENLSQSLRMFFLKGGKLGKDCTSTNSNNSIDGNIGNNHVYYLSRDNESIANNDLRLASNVGFDDYDLGCYIEFNLSKTIESSNFFPNSGIFSDDCNDDLEKIIMSNLEYQMKVSKDIKKVKENIGSTSYKFDKARNRLRFYYPNCDVIKMENLLQECEVTTAIVYKNEEILENEESDNESEYSIPELESVDSYSSLSSASLSSELNSVLSSDRYQLIESIDSEDASASESVLSSVSSDYFEIRA